MEAPRRCHDERPPRTGGRSRVLMGGLGSPESSHAASHSGHSVPRGGTHRTPYCTCITFRPTANNATPIGPRARPSHFGYHRSVGRVLSHLWL